MQTPEPTTARKRGRPTAVERAERRDEILDAAVEEFGRQGYAATTVDQIAAACQVTKRTIYTFFGDKTGVFAAAVGRLHDRVAAADEPDGVPADLPTLATRITMVLHSAEAVGLHRLVVAEANRFPELASAFYASGPERYIGMLGDHVGARTAPALFSLLLGEPHRKRLLGMLGPATEPEARAQAQTALAQLHL